MCPPICEHWKHGADYDQPLAWHGVANCETNPGGELEFASRLVVCFQWYCIEKHQTSLHQSQDLFMEYSNESNFCISLLVTVNHVQWPYPMISMDFPLGRSTCQGKHVLALLAPLKEPRRGCEGKVKPWWLRLRKLTKHDKTIYSLVNQHNYRRIILFHR